MLRAWIVSFLLVAAVTGGVLWYQQSGREEKPADDGGPQQFLDVESIEAYLTIQPQIDDILARSIQDGSATTPEGGAANRAKISGLKQKYGYSDLSWDRLRRRVEDSVILYRADLAAPEHMADLDREIAIKEAALEGASDSVREQLEKDLKVLRARRNQKIEIHEADRALIKRYWTDLNRVVPRVR